MKSVEALRPEDFLNSPVWKFTNSDLKGELAVTPVRKLPVKDGTGKLFGGQAVFSPEKSIRAYISNVSFTNTELDGHFVSASFWIAESWFHLARYHDHDYPNNGPKRLAELLGIDSSLTTSIHFELSGIDNRGSFRFIYSEPENKLSRSQIIALAVEGL